MSLRRPLASLLSLLMAAGPVAAGQRTAPPVITVVPTLAVGKTAGAPVVSGLPEVAVSALPGQVSIGVSPVLPSAAIPARLAAAEPAQPASASPGAIQPLAQAAQAAAERPEQAPAALTNLYAERVSEEEASARAFVAAPAAPATPTSRLSKWVKKPAVKTAAALTAAAAPLTIFAAAAMERSQAPWASLAAAAPVVLAGAIGALIGAVSASALIESVRRHPAVRELLPGRKSGLAAGGALILAASAGALAAMGLAMASPLVASAVLSAGILVSAVRADWIAPYTRWRDKKDRTEGLFDVLERGDKKYLDLKPGQLGRLHMLSGTVRRGLGEKNLATNTQWDFEFAFYFRRNDKRVELVRKNTLFRAAEGSALHKTLSRGVPDSVVASAPFEEVDGRLRVDAADLFVDDFFGFGAEVDFGYGPDYSLSSKLSDLKSARVFSKNVELDSRLTFLRGDADWSPTHLADTRRVELDVRYSLSALPDAGYRPRKASPLIGHFVTAFEDWTDHLKPELETILVNRWRLEKSDPTQAVSPVKEPVVFWIDETIPEEYHDAVRRGALKWNKAFERLGLLDAVQVRVVEPGSGFDASDIRRNMISYRFERDSPYALGNSRANPLTGEIYHAHVTIVPEHARGALALRQKDVEKVEAEDQNTGKGRSRKPEARKPHRHSRSCRHGELMAHEATMLLALLESRGELTPEARRKLVEGYMEELVMHEVGHALGLRHNFVAKSWLTLEQAAQTPAWSASVMDYAPINLASKGEKQGDLFQSELGPYDYLAIEYAYKPLEPGQEEAELSRIAARTSEPGLEYLTDEDLTGVDPRVNHGSLGDDLVKYAGRRVAVSRELWDLLEAQAAAGAVDHQAAYRKWLQGWLGYDIGARHAAGLVGGVYFRRTAGPSAKPAYEPVPAERQREALKFLAEHVFSDEPFAISPALMGAIAPRRTGGVLEGGYGDDLSYFSHDAVIERLRDGLVEHLLDEDRLLRVAGSAKLVGPKDDRLTVREVYDALVDGSFGELSAGGRRRKRGSRSISPMRRRLQDKLVAELLFFIDADEGWDVELRAPAREALVSLQRRLGAALKSGAWDAESRAHLNEQLRRVRRGLFPSKD